MADAVLCCSGVEILCLAQISEGGTASFPTESPSGRQILNTPPPFKEGPGLGAMVFVCAFIHSFHGDLLTELTELAGDQPSPANFKSLAVLFLQHLSVQHGC